MQVGPSSGAAHAAQAPQTQQAATQQSTQEAKETTKAAVVLQSEKETAAQPTGNSGHNINIAV